MAAAAVIQIIDYNNGEPVSYFIPDPAYNIVAYDYALGSTALEVWIRDYPKSPLAIQFPSSADREIFRDILTMGVTGIYYSYDFGAGGSYTPGEDSSGVLVLPSNIARSGIAPTTTTTTEEITTTTTTTSSGETTTTTEEPTTTTTLMPATLNYSFTKASSVAATFKVYKNSVLVATRTSTGSGSLTVAEGDTVYATITSTLTVANVIDLSGGIGGADPLDTVGANGPITLTTFTVANGNNYHVDGTSDPG